MAFIIFSAYQAGISDKHNNLNHQAVKMSLKQSGIYFKEVIGSYEGNREHSLLVDASYKTNVLTLLKRYKQDSALMVNDNLQGFLLTPNGKSTYIGKWTETTRSEALKNPAWTYIEENETFYIVK